MLASSPEIRGSGASELLRAEGTESNTVMVSYCMFRTVSWSRSCITVMVSYCICRTVSPRSELEGMELDGCPSGAVGCTVTKKRGSANFTKKKNENCSGWVEGLRFRIVLTVSAFSGIVFETVTDFFLFFQNPCNFCDFVTMLFLRCFAYKEPSILSISRSQILHKSGTNPM